MRLYSFESIWKFTSMDPDPNITQIGSLCLVTPRFPIDGLIFLWVNDQCLMRLVAKELPNSLWTQVGSTSEVPDPRPICEGQAHW